MNHRVLSSHVLAAVERSTTPPTLALVAALVYCCQPSARQLADTGAVLLSECAAGRLVALHRVITDATVYVTPARERQLERAGLLGPRPLPESSPLLEWCSAETRRKWNGHT